MITIDSAALNHAARVLGDVAPDLPADLALKRFFARHDRLGPRERRAVSHAVFVYFRWLQWLPPRASRQMQLSAALELQSRFDAQPGSVKVEALAARAVPPWSAAEFDQPADYLRSLQREPSLWLRARPGKAAVLAGRLQSALPFRLESAPGGLPLAGAPCDAVKYEGAADLFRTEAFHAGEFEIQDLASQWIGLVAAPSPGETWWDRTAGEGGKTLHLADLMANRGVVWATDRSPRRLAVLQRRAARARLYNIRVADQAPRGAIFDGILLDAPCSGVGTWQRNPHARWTTGPGDVAELAAVQAQLLAEVAPQVKPGGRLIYAVCTLTRSETAAVAGGFAHPEFEPIGQHLLYPQILGTNGMFAAAWRRKK
ncbi:MAG TPA: RsmB/NOP family class I SAM-dependent RNA methyltransferase [Opitutaceae bacterium]|jgi:16S rRNA (cytosine967-C5)-methyltransferase|nr:RsmB/NOP family class I SAM-dependent RNA methyltransferase [Opitutaceae bacterium]